MLIIAYTQTQNLLSVFTILWNSRSLVIHKLSSN